MLSLLFIYLTLGLVLYQDLKYRAIVWWVFPVLLILAVLHMQEAHSNDVLLVNGLFNIGYLMLILILVSVYYSIRERRFTNIFEGMIGLGDLLFLVSVSVIFNIAGFVLFVTLSSLFALLLHYLFRFNKFYANKKTIPLAGFQGLFLMFFFPLIPYIESVVTYSFSLLGHLPFNL